MKIEVTQEGHSPFRIPLTTSPLMIGRAPSNDIVVADDQVSWHHAAVWLEDGAAVVRDMGSRNGTFVNDQRLRAVEKIGPDDRVRLGPNTRVRLTDLAAPGTFRQMLLEELDSAVRVPLRTDRFTIGSAEDADLRVEGAPPRAATLLIDEDGEILLGSDDAAVALVPDQIFEVAGRRLRIVEMAPTAAPTVEPEADRYGYRLAATLNGPVGPQATLTRTNGDSHEVGAENRAILLFLLARQVVSDLADDKPVGDLGWLSDHEVATGIWGKGGATDANSLHVLVYRLRKELQKAGFDPWFIEKRRRALRIRLTEVTVT